MAELEQTAVFTINLNPEAHLRWLEPALDADLTFARWLPTQMVAFPGEPDRRCDTVAELLSHARTQPPWAMVLEVEARARARFVWRLLEYLVRLARRLRHGPQGRDVYQIACGVFVLTGKLNPALIQMKLPGTQLGLTWTAAVLNLGDLSAAEHLQRVSKGTLPRALLPWVPLMQGGGEADVIVRWVEVARGEQDEQRRMDYAGLTRVFAERTGCLQQWSEALEGWEMWKSQVIEGWRKEGRSEGLKEGRSEGLKEGRSEGQKALLLDLVQDRYPALPLALLERIRASADVESIRRWSRALLSCPDQAAFEAALSADADGSTTTNGSHP